MGEGKGEILTPYDIELSGYEIRVEIPLGCAVSTREAYSTVLTREAHSELGRMSLREALSRPVEQWRDCLVNDFEHSVFPLHPEIDVLKRSFYDKGAVYASMSGSGAAVFGLFRRK